MKGLPILSQRSFSDVKSSTTVLDIYDVAVALYSLQDYPLIGVLFRGRILKNE
ncbi:DUF1659 domain-containing protein [Desulfosporosinus sp.]|uniref:DUF1659 domain-containing protein n=1 Tax=Desulfosporosinus sp. TaxID=157907 RepID=UPI0025C23F55|nr:DUF1659 domain-containing protein [Desulfosporosinus sp.]MBC2723019.1 DUF1659 domain-containing protein [Desulfosporosinus sp.]MBC2727201.1 DUF1659 domain-containing protein [Desulfosporosinus sp.]